MTILIRDPLSLTCIRLCRPQKIRFVIRHNSADSVPTSNLISIKMASIPNSKSCDLKHGGAFSNHCEVIILSMKSPARLKYQVKKKMFIDKNFFHTLFDGILKISLPAVTLYWHNDTRNLCQHNVFIPKSIRP